MISVGIERWNPQFLMLKVKHLDPPQKVLRVFDPAKGDFLLKELSASIADIGIIQPVLVRPKANSLKYETVCGDRRIRAAKSANLTAIPAIVVDLNDNDVSKVRLIENLHREDLSPIELGEALLDLRNNGKTIPQLSSLVHKSESWVAKAIGIAKNLSPEAKKTASKKDSDIGLEALYQISVIPKEEQEEVVTKVIDGDINDKKLRESLNDPKDRGKEERNEKSGRPRKEKGFKRSFTLEYDAVVTVSFPTSNPTRKQIIGVLKQAIMRMELENI